MCLISRYNFGNGYCTTDEYDRGSHVVCAIITEDFLRYTYMQGNDLITPRRGFVGLKPGDRWCLCALRWLEAYYAGVAPYIDLNSTSEKALQYIDGKILKKFSINKIN